MMTNKMQRITGAQELKVAKLIGRKVGKYTITKITGQKVRLEFEGSVKFMSLGRLLHGDYLDK